VTGLRIPPHIVNVAMNTKAIKDERVRCLENVKGMCSTADAKAASHLPTVLIDGFRRIHVITLL
jgi:hypothetical protein